MSFEKVQLEHFGFCGVLHSEVLDLHLRLSGINEDMNKNPPHILHTLTQCLSITVDGSNFSHHISLSHPQIDHQCMHQQRPEGGGCVCRTANEPARALKYGTGVYNQQMMPAGLKQRNPTLPVTAASELGVES